MPILGIETSCDETAVAIIERDPESNVAKVCANLIQSQIETHNLYGGVVPEIAARAHISCLDVLVKEAFKIAKIEYKDIDAIAVTGGPGLVGGLLVGTMFGKSLAYSLKKPFIAVNHLEGHALSIKLTQDIDFPYLLLLMSGGHTQTIVIHKFGCYERLGTTIDDAVGETFDKTAKLLGLSYPGGPDIEKLACKGDPNKFLLPHPMYGRNSFDFSFSGLKTAVRKSVEQRAPLSEQDVADVCAVFQKTVSDILYERLEKSIVHFKKIYPNLKTFNTIIGGGVASNQAIRDKLVDLCKKHGFQFVAPLKEFCTDNAAMIAWVGLEYFMRGKETPFSFLPRSRWPLDEEADPKLGSGQRGAKA